MKKIKLLLAAAALMLGSSGVIAQEAGTYYLYNETTGLFLSRGASWGTRAVGDHFGIAFEMAKISDGVFTLKNVDHSLSANANKYLGDNLYTDNGSACNYTFATSGLGYTITKGGGFLTANTAQTAISEEATSTDASVWQLLTKEQYTAKLATNKDKEAAAIATSMGFDGITTMAALVAKISDTDNWRAVDKTSSVGNADIGGGSGAWTKDADGNRGAGDTKAGDGVFQSWNGSTNIHQTISSLPNGIYKVTVQAFYRFGNAAAGNRVADNGNMVTNLYANGNYTQLTSWYNVKTGDSDPNSMAQAHTLLDTSADKALVEVYTYVSDGNLTLGIDNRSFMDQDWMICDNFKLYYYTDQVEDADITALIATIPAEGTIPTAVRTNLLSLQSTLEGAKTIANYNTLDNAITAANLLVTNYARYNSVKTAALAIATSLDTSATDTELNNATTNDAINTAIANLRAAFLAELPNVTIPTDPGYIDVTSVMVDNASVRQNTDFWTSYKYPSSPNGGSFAKCSNNECEFFQQTFKFYQTLALTPGTWEFGVTGFHRAGNHSTYFYAGTDRILIPGVESSVVNTMAQAETYFDGGNGKVALKFLIEAAGNVEIGIDNQDEATDRWTIFRDFTLKYYGAPDYSVYEDQWTALVAEATTAKTTHANVTGTELTALNAAIADSPAGSNLKATYNAKITALQNALTTFTAAAPSYDAYVAYRAETVSLFGEDLANTAVATAPTSAAEAQTAIQNLNIAQYNKVASDYPYSLTSKIGDFSTWTGTAQVGTPREAGTTNSLNWEHWSGVTHPYYEQDNSGYGNAGGWTIQYTKTTTLPAGSYVVKVAARSSAGVTSTVTCTALPGVEISLPCAGNNTRGINTDGKASWDENDTFISTGGLNPTVGGTGAGWQWRFLPFTLADETEVTMTFYAEASTQYQWMSIGDGELLSANNIAAAVAYDETANNTIEDEDVANVTITRTIKASYNTVVLPFDCTLGQVEAAFGTGTEVYAFSENSADANDITINFNKVNAGTISANVPVLVKATTASNEQEFNGVQVKAPAGDVKVDGTNADFVGVYAPTTVAKGDYFIGSGAVYKSAGSTNIKAFRAYIDVDNAAEVKMFVDGIETGIDEINGTAVENGAIYNLAGQRVSKAQKGVFIVNGKKVIVK